MRATSRGTLALAASIAGVLAWAALGPGCVGPIGSRTDASTAPELTVLSDDQLRTAMGQLATGVAELQSILGDRGPVSEDERLEVLRILARMQAAADRLGPDDVPSGHPRIDRNLVRFREKLEIARESVAMEPPRYYLVGAFSGACLACHGSE